jgi:extracellular elastinolytic metalloproteinase
MENGRDGAALEISIDGGTTFTDLGTKITMGKYNGKISSRYGSPISGRSAWTGGVLGTWTRVVVDLSSYAGKTIILRFRLATDNGQTGSGWYIDNLNISGS